ncbi:MAG: hypothetical protein ACSHYB_08425 [Roseibacillus sp.]
MKLLLVYSALTLGVTVENKAKVFALDETKDDPQDFQISLWVDDGDCRFFVPFIFWLTYNTDPHDLNFFFKTRNAHVSGVKLNKIRLVSEDSEEEFVLDKEYSLTSSEGAYYSVEEGYSFGKQVGGKISGMLKEGKHVKFSLFYTISYDNQNPQSFETERTLMASRNTKFSTGWMLLIQGIGASGAA